MGMPSRGLSVMPSMMAHWWSKPSSRRNRNRPSSNARVVARVTFARDCPIQSRGPSEKGRKRLGWPLLSGAPLDPSPLPQPASGQAPELCPPLRPCAPAGAAAASAAPAAVAGAGAWLATLLPGIGDGALALVPTSPAAAVAAVACAGPGGAGVRCRGPAACLSLLLPTTHVPAAAIASEEIGVPLWGSCSWGRYTWGATLQPPPTHPLGPAPATSAAGPAAAAHWAEGVRPA